MANCSRPKPMRMANFHKTASNQTIGFFGRPPMGPPPNSSKTDPNPCRVSTGAPVIGIGLPIPTRNPFGPDRQGLNWQYRTGIISGLRNSRLGLNCVVLQTTRHPSLARPWQLPPTPTLPSPRPTRPPTPQPQSSTQQIHAAKCPWKYRPIREEKIFVAPHPNHCKDVCKGFVLLVKVLSGTVKFVK